VISLFARHFGPCALGLLIAIVAFLSSSDAYGQDSDVEKSFTAQVQPLLQKYCLRCHNADNMKSGIRVDQLDGSLQDRHLFLWRDIGKQMDEAAMPPADEPQPTKEEHEFLSKWIEQALNVARSRDTQKNGSVRRLTVSQYRNTMRELLKLEENLSDILPPDGVSKDGFANNGQVLGLSPLQMEYYFDIAEKSLNLCIVDENSKPTIQNFRMDLGLGINPDPCKDSLILGANSLLLNNRDFVVNELQPQKTFAYTPYAMQSSFDFIEGYVGNDTIRQWKHFDGIYHAVFACMRGTEGYPLGEPYQAVSGGLLLRPAIPSPEIFGESNTYGPMANFKISLRELPDHGNFRVTVRASRYDDGLMLEGIPAIPSPVESPSVRFASIDDESKGSVVIEQPGIYQVDVSCVMNEANHLLRLRIGDRDFSRQIKNINPADAMPEVANAEQFHAVFVVRLSGGPLSLGSSKSEKTRINRVVLTRLSDESDLAVKFTRFEKRSPVLGVHLGLRRDCGSTLNAVGKPQTVSNLEPAEFTFTGAINDFPYPAVEEDNVNYLAGIREIGVRSEYTDGREMPRLKIHSVEFEGPIYDAWPPATHRNIFIESPNRGDQSLYAREIISSFMTRAWRRPVTDTEVDSVVSVWENSFRENHDFQQGIKDALLVVLTSPQFLFLIENSNGPEAEYVDNWELASKLSYFLWNSPPDQELLDAAAANTLKANLTAQTDRLFRDPRSEQFVHEFTSQWLSLEKFDVLEVDRSRFPRLTRDTKTQLREEPIQFVRYLIDNNLSVSHLIHSDFIIANDVVASYYDLGEQIEHGLRFAAISHKTGQLGGVLSQASILAGLSDGRESNPIKRGAWLARRMIAEPPDDPPPNVPQLKDDGAERTLREKLERHRNQEGCAKCHSGIDPWGIAFEQYDAAGRFKTQPADARSTLPDGTEVADLAGLRNYLENDRIDQVAFSVLKHLSSYGAGRSLTYNELEWLKEAGKQLKADGYRMQDMIRFVVTSDLFLKK
jgi:hypothetical protein